MGSGMMNVTDATAATTRPPIIMAFAPTRSARIPAGHWPMACATSAAPTITPTSPYDAPRSRR